MRGFLAALFCGSALGLIHSTTTSTPAEAEVGDIATVAGVPTEYSTNFSHPAIAGR